MNRFRFIGKHFWLHSLVLLLLGVLPFGCSDARKVPDQSVFVSLNAKQMKRALKAPEFEDFYSNYAWNLSNSDNQIKIEFADVTWRDFYMYYINRLGYYKLEESWEKRWDQLYGQYDERVDSVVTSYSKLVSDYFEQFLKVEFVEIVNTYHPLNKEIEKTSFAFKLTPVCDTITGCSFKLWVVGIPGLRGDGESSFQTFTASTLSPFDSSAIYKWKFQHPMKGNLDSFMSDKDYYYNKLKEEKILVTDVKLQNDEDYSIEDLDMPESVRKCILAGYSAGEYKSKDWKQVFEDLYGFGYEEGSDYYVNESKYMSDRRTLWIEIHYYRENLLDDRLYGRR